MRALGRLERTPRKLRRGYTPREWGDGGVPVMGATTNPLDVMIAAPDHDRVLHTVRNVGTRELRIIAVEIKAAT